jgi:hypothetical protein
MFCAARLALHVVWGTFLFAGSSNKLYIRQAQEDNNNKHCPSAVQLSVGLLSLCRFVVWS